MIIVVFGIYSKQIIKIHQRYQNIWSSKKINNLKKVLKYKLLKFYLSHQFTDIYMFMMNLITFI